MNRSSEGERDGSGGLRISRQIPRGCACWRCRHKKTKCDGMRPCRRCIVQMAPEECRDFFLWEPFDDKLPAEPLWSKPTPLRFQKCQQSVKILDKLTRTVISEWVNSGNLEYGLVFDATSLLRIQHNLKALNQSLPEQDVKEVQASAQAFLSDVRRGPRSFRSAGEHSVGLNTATAHALSKAYLSVLDLTTQARPNADNAADVAGGGSSKEEERQRPQAEDRQRLFASNGSNGPFSAPKSVSNGGALAGGAAHALAPDEVKAGPSKPVPMPSMVGERLAALGTVLGTLTATNQPGHIMTVLPHLDRNTLLSDGNSSSSSSSVPFFPLSLPPLFPPSDSLCFPPEASALVTRRNGGNL